MFSRGWLVIFGLGVAEILAFGFAVRAVGATFVVLATISLSMIGFAIVRRRLPSLLSQSRDWLATLTGHPVDGRDEQAVADQALSTVAGVLLLVPGLLTGLGGALLLLPPVRAIVRRFGRNRLAPLVPAGFGIGGDPGPWRRSPHGDVVDVDVVREDKPHSAPPELN